MRREYELDVLAGHTSVEPRLLACQMLHGSGLLAHHMSTGSGRTGTSHVSWIWAYWHVTCQLDLGVLTHHMSDGSQHAGTSYVSWSWAYWHVSVSCIWSSGTSYVSWIWTCWHVIAFRSARWNRAGRSSLSQTCAKKMFRPLVQWRNTESPVVRHRQPTL